MTSHERLALGRGAEQSELARAVNRASDGYGSMILVSGEPGIGKTTLLDQFTRGLEPSIPAYFGRSHPDQGTPPYWPWVQAIRRLAAGESEDLLRKWLEVGASDLALIVPELARFADDAPNRASIGEPELAQFQLFDSVTRFFDSAARTRPFVFVFEDLHWADTPTLSLLVHLVRELSRLPVLIVGSYRPNAVENQDSQDLFRRLIREQASTEMRLGGLSVSETSELLVSVLGSRAPGTEAVAASLHRFTGGNPFFTIEMIEHLGSTSAVADGVIALSRALDSRSPITIPDSLLDVVSQRIERLSPPCQELLQTGAILGREFDADSLGSIGGLSPNETNKLLNEAVDAHIVSVESPGKFLFTHSVFREALRQTGSKEITAKVHLRVGEVLQETTLRGNGELTAQLAYHFTEAALAGAESPAAVQLARLAGDQAVASMAYDRAVEQYERALQVLRLGPAAGTKDEIDLMLCLGEALASGAHRARANKCFAKAAKLSHQSGDGTRLAKAALAYTGEGLESGVVDRFAVQLLRRAEELLDTQDSPERALTMAGLAQELHFSQDTTQNDTLSNDAVAMAERLGDPAVLARVLRTNHAGLRGPGDVQERIQLSARIVGLTAGSEDLHLILGAHLRHIVDLLEAGQARELSQEIDSFDQLAAQYKLAHYSWIAAVLRAMRACLYGQFDQAEELADAALMAGRHSQDPLAEPFALIQKFVIAIHRGEAGCLETEFRAVVDRFPALPAWRAGLGLLYRESDRNVEARGEYENVLASGLNSVPRDANWLMTVDFLAQVCWELGDVEHAQILYDALMPCKDRVVVIGRGVGGCGAVARSLGLLASMLGNHAEARRHFEFAVRLNARLGARAYLAWTRLDFARVLMTGGGSSNSSEIDGLLETALSDGRQLGMARLIRIAEQAKLSLSPQPSPQPTATPTERPANPGIVTILFTDLVDSTDMQRRLGDEQFQTLLFRHNGAVRDALKKYGGSEIKHTGDGMMASFGSAVMAVQGALAIQKRIEEHNRAEPEFSLGLRMGLNAGEPILDHADLFGLSVTLAARLGDRAKPGQILVSDVVRQLCLGKGLPFMPLGSAEFKGFGEPIPIYEVKLP